MLELLDAGPDARGIAVAVDAGRLAFGAGRIPRRHDAPASTPMAGLPATR